MSRVKIKPHILIFLFITFLYGLPAILTLFFHVNSNQFYVKTILHDYESSKYSILWVYLFSITFFIFGSKLTSTILRRIKTKYSIEETSDKYSVKDISLFQRLVLVFFIGLSFMILYQMYRQGFFSASYMDSFNIAKGARNFFTVLCDIGIFLFIFLDINSKGKYKFYKNAFIIIICTTLFVGSRMYVIPFILYFIYSKLYINEFSKKSLIKLGIFGVLIAAGLISMFFIRHGSHGSNGSILFLLVQYESMGVHASLMKETILGWHTSFSFNYIFFFLDNILFVIPRAIFPDKNLYLFFDNQVLSNNLSPYGSFNGEASVILYFGAFFPFVFFLIGASFSYIYELSLTYRNFWIKPFYIYLCCSFMFTFLRNGLLNATKMAVIVLVILMILLLCKRLVLRLK